MLLSIIIPCRNEAGRIADQIAYLQSLAQKAKSPIEIIVCDGQSSDDTAKIARGCGAQVVEAASNRGLQQNAGAQAASGEILWFLHADARPHHDSMAFIIKASSKRETSGGNFRLRFDRRTAATRAFEEIARVQRKRGVYYGDSGIWVRREVFELLGGFQDWPLFEDYDFARRLEDFSRRHGLRTEYCSLPITASARRLEKGAGKVLAQWAGLQCLFSAGASPEKLALYYFRK